MEFRWEPSCVDRIYRGEPLGVYCVYICAYEPNAEGDIDGGDIDRCYRTAMVSEVVCQISPLADTHLEEMIVSHQSMFESGPVW